MQRTEVTAERREHVGKGAARQIRRAGKIPAILYGSKGVPVPLSLNPQQLRTVLAAGGANTLITLKLEGDGAGAGSKVVMLKDYQLDPIRRTMLHADLYEVRMDQAITVEVLIRLGGKAEGVKAGGILQQVHRSITVECLPDRIPEGIDVDVTPLAIGQSIHAGDLRLPEGVKLKTSADDTVVTVVALQAETAATPEEQEAALAKSLAGPEGEAKPAAAGAKGAQAPAAAGKGAPAKGGAGAATPAAGGAKPAAGPKK
jgi:large subunit ribosomal protein L25